MHQSLGPLNETSDPISYVLSGCILLLGERIQLLRRSVRLFEFSLTPESTHNFSLKYRQWLEPTSFRHCRACLQGRWKRWDEKGGVPGQRKDLYVAPRMQLSTVGQVIMNPKYLDPQYMACMAKIWDTSPPCPWTSRFEVTLLE
jgi:hypothetical protein